jgi:hypothetical protein
MNSKEITEKYYKTFYSRTIGIKGTGIVGFLSRYPHKLMEKISHIMLIEFWKLVLARANTLNM